MMPPLYFLMLLAVTGLPPAVLVFCLVANEVRWNRWRRENLEGGMES
jgi:hypothetical protein